MVCFSIRRFEMGGLWLWAVGKGVMGSGGMARPREECLMSYKQQEGDLVRGRSLLLSLMPRTGMLAALLWPE